MDPFEFTRQAVDRAVRTPWKVAAAPERAARMARSDPGATDYEVVFEAPLVRLRRYATAGDEEADEYEPAETSRIDRGDGARGPERNHPIVIAYPFINDPSILDFRPDRSVVRGFLERGFPVYVLEWVDASPLDRSVGLADVIERSLGRCVAFAREESDAEAVHLLGYSTGAPIAAAYAALEPEAVRTLVLQGPPIDFTAGEEIDLLRTLAAEVEVDRFVETVNTVPAAVVEAPFALRKPIEYAVTNPLRLWDRFDDDEFVEEFGRRATWAAGGPTLPAALYRDFVRKLRLENRLLRSDLRVNGRLVDLDDLVAPTLLVLGRDDEFVPPEAALPFLEAIGSGDTDAFEAPTGHVGLSVAPEAHEETWPRVRDWVADRD